MLPERRFSVFVWLSLRDISQGVCESICTLFHCSTVDGNAQTKINFTIRSNWTNFSNSF